MRINVTVIPFFWYLITLIHLLLAVLVVITLPINNFQWLFCLLYIIVLQSYGRIIRISLNKNRDWSKKINLNIMHTFATSKSIRMIGILKIWSSTILDKTTYYIYFIKFFDLMKWKLYVYKAPKKFVAFIVAYIISYSTSAI